MRRWKITKNRTTRIRFVGCDLHRLTLNQATLRPERGFLLAGVEGAARSFNPHHDTSIMKPRRRKVPKAMVTR